MLPGGVRAAKATFGGPVTASSADVNVVERDGYDVFLVAGEDNAIGMDAGAYAAAVAAGDLGARAAGASVLQFGDEDTGGSGLMDVPVLAVDPLIHASHASYPGAGGTSPAVTFGRLYAAHADRTVLLVPCAAAGSSFVAADVGSATITTPTGENVANDWRATDPTRVNLVSYAVQRATRAMAYHPVRNPALASLAPDAANRFVGIVWLQGESDRQLNGGSYEYTSDRYRNDLASLVGRLRAEIPGAHDAAFLAGQPAELPGATDPAQVLVAPPALQALAGTLAGFAYVSAPEGLATLPGTRLYTAAALRELGRRYFAAWLALAPVVSSVPAAVAGLAVTATVDGGLDVRFTPDDATASVTLAVTRASDGAAAFFMSQPPRQQLGQQTARVPASALARDVEYVVSVAPRSRQGTAGPLVAAAAVTRPAAVLAAYPPPPGLASYAADGLTSERYRVRVREVDAQGAPLSGWMDSHVYQYLRRKRGVPFDNNVSLPASDQYSGTPGYYEMSELAIMSDNHWTTVSLWSHAAAPTWAEFDIMLIDGNVVSSYELRPSNLAAAHGLSADGTLRLRLASNQRLAVIVNGEALPSPTDDTTQILDPARLYTDPNGDTAQAPYTFNGSAYLTAPEIAAWESEYATVFGRQRWRPLFLFCDPAETGVPDPAAADTLVVSGTSFAAPLTSQASSTKRVLYFPPGVHFVGAAHRLTARSAANDGNVFADDNVVQHIYIAGGAVVHGSFRALGATRLTVNGRGVLCGEMYYPYQVGAASAALRHSAVHAGAGDGEAYVPHRHLVDGITSIMPLKFHIVLAAGSVARNVKCFAFRFQTDGADVTSAGLVQDCFFKTNDDVLKLLDGRGGLVRRTTVWKQPNSAMLQTGWYAPRVAIQHRVLDTVVLFDDAYYLNAGPLTSSALLSTAAEPQSDTTVPDGTVLAIQHLGHVIDGINATARMPEDRPVTPGGQPVGALPVFRLLALGNTLDPAEYGLLEKPDPPNEAKRRFAITVRDLTVANVALGPQKRRDIGPSQGVTQFRYVLSTLAQAYDAALSGQQRAQLEPPVTVTFRDAYVWNHAATQRRLLGWNTEPDRNAANQPTNALVTVANKELVAVTWGVVDGTASTRGVVTVDATRQSPPASDIAVVSPVLPVSP